MLEYYNIIIDTIQAFYLFFYDTFPEAFPEAVTVRINQKRFTKAESKTDILTYKDACHTL